MTIQYDQRQNPPYGRKKEWWGRTSNIWSSLDMVALSEYFWRTPEQMTRDLHVRCGSSVAKIRVEAKGQKSGSYGFFRCTVLEVNGTKVSAEDQDKHAESIEVAYIPSAEEQAEVITNALAHFDAAGPLQVVSETYAQGFQGIAQLRKRLQERKGGHRSCSDSLI